MQRSKVVLSPIQRKAEFAKHATLNGKAMSVVAEEDFKVSWIHLRECFKGFRSPNAELAKKVADFVGMDVAEFWGDVVFAKAS